VSPCPNTGLEVIAPGRQGFRAKREFNPARGSAYLLWDHTPRLRPAHVDLRAHVSWPRLGAQAPCTGEM